MSKITLEDLFSLKVKVAMVTGGARGIGKGVAEHLAAVGADIVILDVLLDAALITAQEFNETYGVRTLAMYCDVTDPDSVEKCIREAAGQMGTLDLLFNNAGIGMHKHCLEVTPEDWKKINDVNYNGVFYVATAFARYLVSNKKGGSIVNTASMSGSIVNVPQEQVAYNASKAGVIHMTHSLAVELARYGIRVNCISPGYMHSPVLDQRPQERLDFWCERIPLHRIGYPKDLATGVIYLMADSAAYTTGCNLIIDGGYTLY